MARLAPRRPPVEDWDQQQEQPPIGARHNVKAVVKRVVAQDIEAGELLLSHAADISADMIVMGGYSRPRITQLVWGGVTRVLLNSMTVPVLMSH